MARSDKTRFGKLALDDELRLTAGYAHHHAPAWSRDGRLLAMTVGRTHDASWVIVDRRGRVARTLDGPAAGTAAFAPDGSLAFERRFGASSEIWLTPGGDAPPVRLLGGDGRLYRHPTFSPDGQTLCCSIGDEPEGRSSLALVTLADGRRRELPTDPARTDVHPAFTPSGAELVFEGVTGDDHALYALALGGSAVQRLTPAGEHARWPAVIDETLLIYERGADGEPGTLALLDRGRARAQVLVEDGACRREPACFLNSSNGRVRLAFSLQPAPDSEARPPGEPPLFDIFSARLRGVTARESESESESEMRR